MSQPNAIALTSPERISADYDRLREEGIHHLENLATEIWTDFNAHDPGITLLELLCYALTDLSYRTQLPIEDLVAGQGGGKNFFMPEEILPGAPVTVKDFRKLLIDVEGVKNAWIQPSVKNIMYNDQHKTLAGFNRISLELDAENGTEQTVHKVQVRFDRIILELDDTIDALNTRQVDAVKKRVLARLHANRNLCQDFDEDIVVAHQEEVVLCLDLELESGVLENRVMAEALLRLEEYLSPSIRFYTLADMTSRGYRIDEIYNGALLQHGFIDDAALEASAAPRETVYFSDLYRVAASTPGVKSVRRIQLKKPGASAWQSGAWDVPTLPPDAPASYTPGSPDPESPYVFKILTGQSCFFKAKPGADSVPVAATAIDAELAFVRMMHACEGCAAKTPDAITSGQFLPDLDKYRSLQFDLPAVYRVGDHQVEVDASQPSRVADTRQLQAYLLFFDQILAGYLSHLGLVQELFAVEQDTARPTNSFRPLYEIPGVRELIEPYAAFTVNTADWTNLAGQLPADARALLQSGFPNNTFDNFPAFREAVMRQLGAGYTAEIKSMLDAYFWNKYKQDPENNYRQLLAKMAESPNRRQTRRNNLLNHLIARFGEIFADYTTSLYWAQTAPDNNPWWQHYDDYLTQKAHFLSEINTLGARRGLGYNYRAFDKQGNHPDVWNTANVAGVKKRVAYLLGLEDWRTASVFAEPPYEIDLVTIPDKSGPRYQLLLRKRQLMPGAGPQEGSAPLMTSMEYPGRKAAQDARDYLYKNLHREDFFSVKTVNGKAFVSFQDVLVSESFERLQEADYRREVLLRLVLPDETRDHDGFHVLENILLIHKDMYVEEKPLLTDVRELSPDPISFRVTVVAPNWTPRFRSAEFRQHFEQIFRQEIPAHVAVRFGWVNRDTMLEFELKFKNWMEEKARCTPNNCNVKTATEALVALLTDGQKMAGDTAGPAAVVIECP